MKTSEKERLLNRGYRSTLRNSIRDLRAESNKENASKMYRDVASLLDKAVSNGIIHKKNASRNKSRLAHFVAQLG